MAVGEWYASHVPKGKHPAELLKVHVPGREVSIYI